jgi:hypothetical protein
MIFVIWAKGRKILLNEQRIGMKEGLIPEGNVARRVSC